MELTPDSCKSSEGLSAADDRPYNPRNSESERFRANGGEIITRIVDWGAGDVMEIESMNSEDTTGTVKEGKKRAAHNELLEEGDVEDEFSSNAHNGVPGVNGMAKAKPAAKKPKLEEPSNIRDPACWRCREADIPCIGNKTRSSCNACFHHHWKCATNPPPVKGKKPKNNTISANALKHLLSHSANAKNTRSKVVGEKGNIVSDSRVSLKISVEPSPPANSFSISAPTTPQETVSDSAPTAKGKEKAKAFDLIQPSPLYTSYTSSDLPVLMLAPPSVSLPTLKLGPPAPSVPAESSVSASSSRHNRTRTRPQDSATSDRHAGVSKSSRKRPVAPKFPDPVGDKMSGDRILGWPGHTKPRTNPGRCARPTRKEFDLDTDEEEQEEEKRRPSADKGKQKAHESGDISELSSPPSSVGSTPDPSTSLLPTGALEPRPLPTASTLPTVVTTLNALTSMVKTMRTDLGEVKDTTTSLSGSKSTLEWGIALDKLDRQGKLINQQSKVIQTQGKMISAMVKNMKELMGEKFMFDFDTDEGAGGGKCSTKENGNAPSQPVAASVGATHTGSSDSVKSLETALRPVGTDMPTNQTPTSHTGGRDNGKPLEQPERTPVIDTASNRGPVYAPSRPLPVQKASSGSTPSSLTPTTTIIATHHHELPPPRATSFMRPQQKPSVSQESRNQVSISKPAESPVGSPVCPSSVNEERPKFSTAHWSQTRVHDDSDEERDELLDDPPMKSSHNQRGWVKTQMMALR